jgi:aminoglycoside phosphotransferase (APT) family kinase protein
MPAAPATVDIMRRLRAIDAVAGSLAGAYEPGELDRLRAEWR